MSRRVAQVQATVHQLGLAEARFDLAASQATAHVMSLKAIKAFFGEAEYRSFAEPTPPETGAESERHIDGPLQLVVEASGFAWLTGSSGDRLFSVRLPVSVFRAMENAEPAVPARLSLDGTDYEVEFDAAPYLAYLADQGAEGVAELGELAACEFGHNYAADRVAEYAEGHDVHVSDAFAHLRESDTGFEVKVDGEAALDWLHANRPGALKALLCDSRYSQAPALQDWLADRTVE